MVPTFIFASKTISSIHGTLSYIDREAKKTVEGIK